jgi:hypothetical protein
VNDVSPLTRLNSFLTGAFHKWAALGPVAKIFVAIAIVVGAAAPSVPNLVLLDKDQKAPVDFGDGPGKPPIPKPLLKRGDVPKHPPKVTSAPKAGNVPAPSVAPKASTVPPKSSNRGRLFRSGVCLANHPPFTYGTLARWARVKFRHRPNGCAGCSDGL